MKFKVGDTVYTDIDGSAWEGPLKIVLIDDHYLWPIEAVNSDGLQGAFAESDLYV